jgi:hypothetical protein
MCTILTELITSSGLPKNLYQAVPVCMWYLRVSFPPGHTERTAPRFQRRTQTPPSQQWFQKEVAIPTKNPAPACSLKGKNKRPMEMLGNTHRQFQMTERKKKNTQRNPKPPGAAPAHSL